MERVRGLAGRAAESDESIGSGGAIIVGMALSWSRIALMTTALFTFVGLSCVGVLTVRLADLRVQPHTLAHVTGVRDAFGVAWPGCLGWTLQPDAVATPVVC